MAGLLLLAGVLLACAPATKRALAPTSHPTTRPAVTSRPAAETKLVQLQFADRRSLARRTLKLVCGKVPVEARTDAAGRVRLPADHDCRLSLGDRELQILTGQRRAMVSPDLRVELELMQPIKATVILDSRVDALHPLRRGRLSLRLRHGLVMQHGRQLVRALAGQRLPPPAVRRRGVLAARRALLQAFWKAQWRYRFPDVPKRKPSSRRSAPATRRFWPSVTLGPRRATRRR